MAAAAALHFPAHLTHALQMSQAIVISGESGSGKTVSTSHIIDYLCCDATLLSPSFATPSSPSAATQLLSHRLLHSGCLFESLGNACTLRNDNSR